ncbi:hypothetical protein CDAR_238761 [Caerostris darwini]|uniref:Uncharacterized protein n=1 Tax=Caerostris darwini TaxID=1538125 RepID=A0AAV4PQF2_9ARAC|nr:hypothetical protein CDAR_238761 [Caerostris darwini]
MKRKILFPIPLPDRRECERIIVTTIPPQSSFLVRVCVCANVWFSLANLEEGGDCQTNDPYCIFNPFASLFYRVMSDLNRCLQSPSVKVRRTFYLLSLIIIEIG